MMTLGKTPDQSPLDPQNDAEVYDDGCLRVEHRNYFVKCKGSFVSLQRAEFLLLSRMVRNMDRVVRTADLWEHVWGTSKPLNSESLHVTVCRLRRKFEPFGFRIDNMINVGYGLSHSGCCDFHSSTNKDQEARPAAKGLQESQCC
jgi:DNA-binding response OmpR family regulator